MRPIFDEFFAVSDSYANHIAAGGDRAKYAGTDIGSPIGYWGFAPIAGRVNSFTDAPAGPEGKRALVTQFFPDDTPGLMLEFVHLSSYDKVSGRVAEGERIFVTGNSGWSSGPHTHTAAVLNGVRIDPTPYLNRYYYNLLGKPQMEFKVGSKYKVVERTGIWARTGSGITFPSNFPWAVPTGSVFELISGARSPGKNAAGEVVDQFTWLNGKSLNGETFWIPFQDGWIVETGEALTNPDGTKPTPPAPVDPCASKLAEKDAVIASKDKTIAGLNQKTSLQESEINKLKEDVEMATKEKSAVTQANESLTQNNLALTEQIKTLSTELTKAKEGKTVQEHLLSGGTYAVIANTVAASIILIIDLDWSDDRIAALQALLGLGVNGLLILAKSLNKRS